MVGIVFTKNEIVASLWQHNCILAVQTNLVKSILIRPPLEKKLPTHRFKRFMPLLCGLSLACSVLGGCGGGHSGSSVPTVDPSRQSVVFQSDRDGDFEILRMNGDGSSVTRVTDNLVKDSNPSLSPDGKSIVFISNRTGSNEIFIIDEQGTHQLTHNQYSETGPRFSPDGRKILYASQRNETSNLFLLDIASGIEKPLTTTRALEDSAVFAPDGRIVFSSSSNNNFYQIYEIKGDGSQMKQITQGQEYNQTLPTVSPDGKTIAFVMRKLDVFNIYLMDMDGRNIRPLMAGPSNNTEPVFSRDGKRIFFSSNRTGNFEIYSINLDGLDLQNLTKNPATDRVPST
jgi:TolB protein